MFPQLRIKIEEAKAKLEAILVSFPLFSLFAAASVLSCNVPFQSQDAQSSPEDVDKAKEAIAAADGAIREAS